jgi:hypothetical protein
MRGLWRLGRRAVLAGAPVPWLPPWLMGPGAGRPGGLAAYPAGFGLGLAVQRAFIILPMRCSPLALAWM